MSTDSQEPVFAFLADPATHDGAQVRRIDTHAASVFLAGPYAYKVKRAVRFPFLDYSSLEKRKTACEDELAVNRPFAAAIYRRVVPITRDGHGRLALGGAGTPIEWAVEMRRFDESRTLDQLANQRRIDVGLADRLAQAVAGAHASAPVVRAEPWLDAIGSFIEQNDAAFQACPELFPNDQVAGLARASRTAFDRTRPQLLARGASGLVRRCHGDLHLGNIVLLEDAPVLFDAVEFDPLIAAGDVLYDLAFLLMDLIERDLQLAANTVLNRYLAETRRVEDLDALAALPLFLSLRAAIRAKVTAARLVNAPAAERSRIVERAQAYFRLALKLISPAAPILVAIGGFSGTGKSVLATTLAPNLAPAPGAVVLRSDLERKALCGVAETDRLPEDAYSQTVTDKVYGRLADKALRIVHAGHSAIVDAVFARPAEREEIGAIAKTGGVPFRGLFLTADLATRLARVDSRKHDASDAGSAVARQQETYDLGTMSWTQIDAAGTADRTLKRALACLA
jgi:aminoglycoside phosphotransferase family enzyme/predicted kinase